MDAPGSILRRHGLRPKKSWGQNFLGDSTILARIASHCRTAPGQELEEVARPQHAQAAGSASRRAGAAEPQITIVELGAGLGHLTEALLQTGARVIAIERDRDLAAILRSSLGGHPGLSVVEANAATISIRELAGGRATIVGNLPYHLTTPILFHLLGQRADIQRMLFTLQAEVVQRLAAKPGGKAWGVLSVQAQVLCDVEELFRIPAAAFHPAPEVDSAVVSLTPLHRPRASLDGTPHFARVVRAAFGQRRKTLANALSGGGFDCVREALAEAGIDPSRRAETLTLPEFSRLADSLNQPGRAPEPARNGSLADHIGGSRLLRVPAKPST